MGSNQATSFSTTHDAPTKRRPRRNTKRVTLNSWKHHPRSPHYRPFKRRATPAAISDKAGDGEDARSAKRPRRLGPETQQRSGGGPTRRRYSSRLNSGTVPEQLEQPSTENVNSATKPESEREGDRSPADVYAENHESALLRMNPLP